MSKLKGYLYTVLLPVPVFKCFGYPYKFIEIPVWTIAGSQKNLDVKRFELNSVLIIK